MCWVVCVGFCEWGVGGIDAMKDDGVLCAEVRQHGVGVLGVKDSYQVWALPASAFEEPTVLRQLKVS